jgi:hypothetical protein
MSDRDDDDLPLHLEKKRRRDVVSSARSTTAGVCIPASSTRSVAHEVDMIAETTCMFVSCIFFVVRFDFRTSTAQATRPSDIDC